MTSLSLPRKKTKNNDVFKALAIERVALYDKAKSAVRALVDCRLSIDEKNDFEISGSAALLLGEAN